MVVIDLSLSRSLAFFMSITTFFCWYYDGDLSNHLFFKVARS